VFLSGIWRVLAGSRFEEPPGSKLWSKAGWTTQTRHDAAYVELPSEAKFVIIIFTTDHANEREIIATIVRKVVEGLSR